MVMIKLCKKKLVKVPWEFKGKGRRNLKPAIEKEKKNYKSKVCEAL
jgi:hypothetical protein